MKLYQVITLRSQENILDSDVTIKTFSNIKNAKDFFRMEKEDILSEIYGVSDSEDVEIRDDNNTEFCVYDDNTGFVVKVKLVEVKNNSFVSVSF